MVSPPVWPHATHGVGAEGMASGAQVRMLHVMRRDAGIEDCGRRQDRTAGCCEYHDQLQAIGVQSSSQLDNRGVDTLKRWLVARGARDTTQRHVDRWRLEIDRRYDRLHDLAALLGDHGSFSTQAQRWAFNERQCGLKWPQKLAHGNRIIVGQKHYEARLVDQLTIAVLLAVLCSRAGVRVDDLFAEFP